MSNSSLFDNLIGSSRLRCFVEIYRQMVGGGRSFLRIGIQRNVCEIFLIKVIVD